MKSTSTSYSSVAVTLHWIVALAVFVIGPVGMFMHDLPLSPLKLQIYSWHKWVGVTVFLLMGIRIFWRMLCPPPVALSSASAMETRLAAIAHVSLYVLFLLIPLSGWLASSAKGFSTVYFGVIALPDLVGKDKVLGHFLSEMHGTLNGIAGAIIFLHVGAALLHHFVKKDGTLKRMLPCLK